MIQRGHLVWQNMLRLLSSLVLCLCSKVTMSQAQAGRTNSLLRNNAYQTRNVFVVCIDGLRGTEAFDAEHPEQYIPHMWNDLKPQGSLYHNIYN